jgi:hypothetical protein
MFDERSEVSMQILAHITEEASRAIAMGMLLLLVAAVTIVAFIIWGIVALVRSSSKQSDEERDADK